MLKCCVELGKFDVAEKLFFSFRDSLEFQDYMHMIRGFARQDKYAEARKIVKLLRDRDPGASFVRQAYNALLDCVVSPHHSNGAGGAAGEQLRGGGPGGAAREAASGAPRSYTRAMAREILQEMESLGICDSVSYNTFLKAFCHDLEDAFACLQELRCKQLFTPDRVSYNSVLNTGREVRDMR